MASIAPGTIVGGRFAIERRVATHAIGDLLFARDQKTGKGVAVWVLARDFAADTATFEHIREEVRIAARLKHRSLVGTYGIGSLGEQRFVACEWVQGTSLAELAVTHRQQPLSVRGVYNVAAHVCGALSQVHAESSCHGGLRPHVVWISKSGRVKVGELGLDVALARSGRCGLLTVEEQSCLAPEVTRQRVASAASDVYGMGVLLYTMLTGRWPIGSVEHASAEHPEGSPELDAIVARCMAEDPAERFASIAEVRAALLPRVARSKEPPPLEFGVDVEIDVDVALSIPPRATTRRSAPRMPAVTGAASDVATAPRRVHAGAAAAGAPPVPVDRGGDASAIAVQTLQAAATEQQLAALMTKLTENDAPRWMAIKDGLDHGPFTARELIKLIVEGQILEHHGLFNMRTEERKPLVEWQEFREFVEQYKLRKVEADHAVALEQSQRRERTSTMAKLAILAGVIAVVAVAGGGYLLSRRAAEARKAEREVDLAGLFESGRVKVRGSAGILKSNAPRTGRRPSPGARPSGDGLGSYEDAMNQAIELGDVAKSGGEGVLRPAEIEAVMNRNLNSMFSCVSQELRAKRSLGDVQIDLAIRGNGQVMGSSVNTGSPEFKRCIAGKVRALTFPSFASPRMGARYAFSVE